MASTDARPVPQKNIAYRVTFPILDADGDLVAGATILDSEVSKDGGTFVDCTNEATEIATASGMYFLDLTAPEMNADTVAVIVKSAASGGGKTTPIVLYPEEVGDIRVNVTQMAADVIAAATIANGAIDAATFAAGAIDAAAIANGAIDAATFAVGAIDAAALAADAGTEIADALLKRDMSVVTGEASRSLLNALRFLRNKWSISGATLTVTKEDDATTAFTSALTTDAAANPITASDPT